MIRLSLARPVAVAMTYSAVALLGIAAWRNVPIELLPDTQLPRLNVTGSWRGASPETVEAFLTAPLESTIQQVRGVERIISQSFESQGIGTAQVDIEFQRDTDMDFARLDLSERIATLEETLPPGVGQVSVSQYVPEEFQEQNSPFLLYTFTGPYTLEALRRHLDEVIAPEVSQIEGVSLVRVFGGRDRRLEIELVEEEMGALGLDPVTVQRAISDLDLVGEAGIIREGDSERTITIMNRPGNADDVRNAVITAVGGTPVRIRDIATVYDTYEEPRQLSRINRQASVGFEVLKGIGVNTVRTADAVKVRLAELERLSPFGSELTLEDDQSEEIERQLSDLRTRALISAVVIFFVLLGFLRSFRSAALIFTTIGFSVLIALNLIYFGGLTLNLLTLMGLALGFGLIVDNSIVVLENIYRRWQGGEEALAAAEGGAREVVLPIFASTATTLIVFVPFVYLQGELRVFYVPLAIVVALTLVASLFVAFTFIPALAARSLAARPSGGKPPASTIQEEPFYLRFYADLVGFNIRFPGFAMVVTVLVFGGSYYLFDRYVNTWAMWGGGRGQETYIAVQIELPRGSNLERSDQLMQYFEERVAAIPEVERFSADVNQTFGSMRITFPDSLENTQIPVIIKEQMVAFSHTFTGAEVRVFGYGPSFYGGGGSAPNYGIKVLGYNYERVRDIAEDLGRRLERLSRIVDVDTNASSGRFQRDKAWEFIATVDRNRLAQYELTVDDLIGRLNAAVAGTAGLDFLKLGGEEVQYQVKLKGNLDMDVLALTESLIDTPAGNRIRLGDVIAIEERDVLARIRREDQQYERTVAYEFRGPSRLGDLIHETVIASTEVPPGYTVEASDQGFFIDDEERGQIWMVLAVALLLVYMVTAALFESLLQPLCVIVTVPMALIGVYLIFFLAEASFTREAYVGVIMMLGVVVNNAILLVDHVNGVRRRHPNLPLDEAVVRGTLERVRPILMTTATTVLGLLPLVLFGDGAGTNIWDALALVLIGGLLSSTIFVLTLTPAVYHVLERGGPMARRPILTHVPVPQR
ncbi:MAG: efflux RND transporter permease subunit [Gemmatimonadetes bacterium]|nr:efflux RND transporter permease subunit [Gemmatimonadota bacterium]MDA1104868.1 efflux RND transporter permease subunit [Gemmatimonadota bacterium]